MNNLITSRIFGFAERLRFPTLFLVTLGLFVVDLLIPDFIPFVDEILLGLATLMLSRWKRQATSPPIDVRPG